ncbi:MAG TPA: HAMP domain-containing sensor histidine kinase [Sphingomonas sp.]|nr:HAMP domain-containing sensor histidine kinase [Sphingomonas sp.]
MKGWLARWDVTRDEQATMTFDQVLTNVNVRRVELACLLALLTQMVEYGAALRSDLVAVQRLATIVFLFGSLALRRFGGTGLRRAFVAAFAVSALLFAQTATAAMGAHGRLTSSYPMMLSSLTLLFVLPPRIVALGLGALFVSYCAIVFDTVTQANEKVVAVQNAAIVSIIAVVAAALIHSGRRRDHEQRRAIRIQNGKLVERNAELDMLMAITAHDLRSPLYGLRNLFDLAIRRAAQEPGLPRVVLGQAMASIDAMLALATRLLDAHAAEHRSPTRLVAEDVRGHVLAAADRIGPLAQSAGIGIQVDLPDRPLIATLDAGALAQILDNLLSNGARFSPPGGTLTIDACAEIAYAAIRVRDRGPGIEPARYDGLFRKFHHAGGERRDGVPTSGMGLFIVATLAEQMGARVRCEAADGGGAAFVVTIPTPP